VKRLDGVSVVVPAYRSTSTLAELVERVDRALGDRAHEVVIVDDGSPPATWAAIAAIARANPRVTGLRLGRNAGQHNALLAGVRRATMPLIVTMDDDLQNPPEEIAALLAPLDRGEADVVYGRPRAIGQPFWRRRASVWSRSIIAWATGPEAARTAVEFSSFRAFRAPLRDGFDADLGPSVSLDALLSWSTSRFTGVTVDHHGRAEGRSTYSARRLIRFALDTATGYSARPLKLASYLGLATVLFGLGALAWVVGRTIVGGVEVPGFAFLASIVVIFSGAQLVSLGIIGEYLSRMHFRTMRKPSYVVAEETAPARPVRTSRTPRAAARPTGRRPKPTP